MGTSNRQRSPHRLRGSLADPLVRVALLTAAATMVEAALAKNVLDVRLDFISQSVGLWIFIAYLLIGRRDRAAELGASAAIVAATAAVLVLYAL